MSDPVQEAERLCGCGYRESLHMDSSRGGANCQLAEARYKVRAQAEEIARQQEEIERLEDRLDAKETKIAMQAEEIATLQAENARLLALKREACVQLRAARAQALEDAANTWWLSHSGGDSVSDWLRARAAAERKEP
jgi:chromosome segregation ATPase